MTEYEKVISGEKPMAAYYKASGEDFFYDDWDKYEECRKIGNLIRKRFFIRNNLQSFNLIYECFSRPENSWRMDLYALIKKIGQSTWNEDLERIEGMLLGHVGFYANDGDRVRTGS